jgi:hypothetical protein
MQAEIGIGKLEQKAIKKKPQTGDKIVILVKIIELEWVELQFLQQIQELLVLN